MTHKQEDKSPFCQDIFLLRKDRQLTFKNLSQLSGISVSYLSRLESGERKPSPDTVIQLAQAFDPDNPELIDVLLIKAGFSPINMDLLRKEEEHFTTIYENILKKDPDNFRAYVSLIQALIKAGKGKEAEEKINQGLGLFDDSVRLQSLMSTLALSQNNFSEALNIQQSALDYYYKKHPDEQSDEDLANYLLNMGVIYFLQGYDFIDQKLESESKNNFIESEKWNQQAIESLTSANQYFEQALNLEPENIYLLDEIARVKFNLAYLITNEKEAKAVWNETIDCFKKVIYSPSKLQLGNQALLESSVFLIHSYSKSNRFEEAEFAIHLLENVESEYWLLQYIKACFYSLRFNTTNKQDDLQAGLFALQQAATKTDKNNATKQEAINDPDLANLRLHSKQEFEDIINFEEENHA